jgi:transcriptional regulator with XRE-family HTH domain
MNDRIDALGLSRYQVAKLSGLDQATVKRILEGDRVPSVETWIQILIAIEVDPYLIPKEDKPAHKESGRVWFN